MRRAILLALALAPGIDGINASPWSVISWRVAVGYWDSLKLPASSRSQDGNI